jgi:predicted nucleic acid-binding protein
LAYAESDSLQTNAITGFELLSGARYGKRGDTVRRLVGAIPVLLLDREAAARDAEVRQRLARGGVSIGMGTA